MAQKLTDAVVRALETPVTGYTIEWDRAAKGFGVRVTRAGVKSFILNYRAGGRERRYTIGSWPEWSTTAARTEAASLKREIDRDRDPMAQRAHRRQAPTVTELCDRFLAEHVEVHNRSSTAVGYRRMVEKIIKPRLGRLKVEAVDHPTVERLHREMKATPRQANHAIAMLSKMLSLAERWGLRPLNSNPCRHLRRYPEVQRTRYPLPEELELIGAALREAEVNGALRPDVVACIRFLALSGARLSEAIGLELSTVDFRTGAWTLADAKTGARMAMLGAPALAVLANLSRTDGRAFPSVNVDMVERAWTKLRGRAAAPDLRLHDLRHGVGTYAGAAGLNAFMIRDLLGHKTMALTGRYVSRHVDPLRAAADAVSGQIAAALDGSTAEIIALRQRR